MLLMCFYVNLELKMSREAIWGFLDNINVPYMVFVLLYRTALILFCQNVLLNLLWTQSTLLIVEIFTNLANGYLLKNWCRKLWHYVDMGNDSCSVNTHELLAPVWHSYYQWSQIFSQNSRTVYPFFYVRYYHTVQKLELSIGDKSETQWKMIISYNSVC